MPPQSEHGQGDLFPRCSPDSLTLYAERLRRRVTRLAPALSPAEVERVLGEIALVELLLDRIESFASILARACSRTASLSSSSPRKSTTPSEPRDYTTWSFARSSAPRKPPAWAVRRDARVRVVR